ncbi:MAG: CoA transferase, partial [Rhodospirillales bacterium]|nr:CoA transferase [Rhodospirillales bacterium]
MLFLEGVRVLDFTTLLPGPLATLVLAEAGADVIKIERPGGDPTRHSPPFVDGESVPFAMLNRGKRSIEIDLKKPGAASRILALAQSADVVIEQFRPGVM